MLSLGQRLLWILLVQVSMAVSAQAQIYGRAHSDWRAYVIPQYGTRIDFPPGMFVPAGNPDKGVGQRFVSNDRRATLSIYALRNEAGDTPGSYLKPTCASPDQQLNINGLPDRFLPPRWRGRDVSITAGATFRAAGAQFTVLTWNIHKRKSGHGTPS
jgi:hypothetical protein